MAAGARARALLAGNGPTTAAWALRAAVPAAAGLEPVAAQAATGRLAPIARIMPLVAADARELAALVGRSRLTARVEMASPPTDGAATAWAAPEAVVFEQWLGRALGDRPRPWTQVTPRARSLRFSGPCPGIQPRP
jgi:hypothetical protein